MAMNILKREKIILVLHRSKIPEAGFIHLLKNRNPNGHELSVTGDPFQYIECIE